MTDSDSLEFVVLTGNQPHTVILFAAGRRAGTDGVGGETGEEGRRW